MLLVMSDQAQPRLLDDESAKRLGAALKEAQDALEDHQALPVGSIERVEKYRDLTRIGAEINSYFSN